MDVAGIREALRRQPFEPFVMRLADGRSVPVRHPDFMAVHPRRIVVIAEDGAWSVVEPLLVASLDCAQPKTRRNGKHRPPKDG
jgi:hypothetical protein